MYRFRLTNITRRKQIANVNTCLFEKANLKQHLKIYKETESNLENKICSCYTSNGIRIIGISPEEAGRIRQEINLTSTSKNTPLPTSDIPHPKNYFNPNLSAIAFRSSQAVGEYLRPNFSSSKPISLPFFSEPSG